MERNMVSLFLTTGEKVLLLYREGSKVANHLWIASAGGHMEKDELNNARQAVLRELKEETGLSEADIRRFKLKYVTLRNAQGELRQNFYFFAELPEGEGRPLASTEGTLQWFTFSETESLPMPFSARHALRHYIQTGRKNDALYGGVADGETVCFTELKPF